MTDLAVAIAIILSAFGSHLCSESGLIVSVEDGKGAKLNIVIASENNKLAE